ncbi:MAG: hypothetical protein KQI35_03560 [Bacteroidetes bacterium]|nr:hypothetical protein [Bacteroidota bacterium]
MKVGILRNENPDSAQKWEIACRKRQIDYEVIDLTAFNWLENVRKPGFDFFLLRPSGNLTHYKTLYDERLYVISKVLNLRTYPFYEETIIYENKKLLCYYLDGSDIPHPKSWVFYSKKEAKNFIKNYSLPIVAKTSIGASGSGVSIIRTADQATKYIARAFSNKGIKRSFGPNKSTGTPSSWAKKAIKNPAFFKKKVKQYLTTHKYGERDFVIFQKYIPHNFEWRMVKIGESYFGHQKVKQADKASGTKGIDYVTPPNKLLDFTRDLCDKNNFHFMAVDLFEDGEGGFLVNELQTIFGHVQDFILAINNRPGRFLHQNGEWVFQEGDFNTNESYDLRLETAIKLYKDSLK